MGEFRPFGFTTLHTHTHTHTLSLSHTHTLIFPKSLLGELERNCVPLRARLTTARTVKISALGSCAWRVCSGLQNSGPKRWAENLS